MKSPQAVMFPGAHMPTETPKDRKARDAAFRQWVHEEERRIAGQRRALASIVSPARAALIDAMLARAWALLDAGECEAADALLEFVPADQAEALLGEFFDDA